MTTTEEVILRERQFLLQTYNRYPGRLERGKGVFLFDLEGKKYLDFVAGLGVNALGHAHPRIVKTIRDQAARADPPVQPLLQRISGTPRRETLLALRPASRLFLEQRHRSHRRFDQTGAPRQTPHRRAGEKSTGRASKAPITAATFGSMSLTGQDKYRKGFEPLLEEVTFVPRNDVEALRAAVNDKPAPSCSNRFLAKAEFYECSVDFLKECRALADRSKSP